MTKSICFITAIYGGYEKTCKPFAPQSIPSDFICFTDNPSLKSNGWEIDSFPYHVYYPSDLDKETSINSLRKVNHPFHIAKYYKQSFQCIPKLQKYDIIVWLDGTIELTNPNISRFLIEIIPTQKMVGWHHNWRFGNLKSEVLDSAKNEKYRLVNWNNHIQPFQDVIQQYKDYLSLGYDENFFSQFNHPSPHFGIWITCFIAFDNQSQEIKQFLKNWYQETLERTTQDQISFSFVVQKSKLIPFTLPLIPEHGFNATERTVFYIKHGHLC